MVCAGALYKPALAGVYVPGPGLLARAASEDDVSGRPAIVYAGAVVDLISDGVYSAGPGPFSTIIRGMAPLIENAGSFVPQMAGV